MDKNITLTRIITFGEVLRSSPILSHFKANKMIDNTLHRCNTNETLRIIGAI